MKKLTFVLASILLVFGLFSVASARVSVRGYYKPSRGTYVMPHYRSNPDGLKYNNYSTSGNYNPYTGKRGYSNPYKW